MPTLLVCPKHMEYGPCGGVRADGRCEVAEAPCAFLDTPVVPWSGLDRRTPIRRSSDPIPSAAAMRDLLRTRPIVVADLPARACSSASIREVAAVLTGHVDAVLVGDSGDARVQFPPAYRAALLHGAGLTVLTGLNCRDRNRVALQGELAGLADAGVAGVLCLTGDHTDTGERPDAMPVFDLDSTELAALAAAAGHLVAVAESPTVPPASNRPGRLVQKLAAGAEVCFVDHAGGAEPVRAFSAAARDAGADCAFIACVPLVVDAASAALLQSFTALVLPQGFLAGIMSAADPFTAGIEAAVRLSAELLEAGVDGIDLSGGSGGAGEVRFAEAMAETADRLGLR
ncbi:methylenetetrahydrofolate reductase C-terminal domain-containing protein [uncultured Amnibacterium sp.]|uniref:methylenetetrahydrofolate reductase C-terminal domain-containing protein n=1 Tax=uncultured Amnibacterium sp. TaxID=1631851 RepID=UPI0035C96424